MKMKIEAKEQPAKAEVIEFNPKIAEKVRRQFVMLGQQKVLAIEKKTGKKPDDFTSAIDRSRFRMMNQTFEETNSVIMKPIFRDYMTLACERQLFVKDMLRREQARLDSEKKACRKIETADKPNCKESKADQFRNQIVSMMGGTVTMMDTENSEHGLFEA